MDKTPNASLIPISQLPAHNAPDGDVQYKPVDVARQPVQSMGPEPEAPTVEHLQADLDRWKSDYRDLQDEYLTSQQAALRYLAAVVFHFAGQPKQDPAAVERGVEQAITNAVEAGKSDIEAKAAGYDAARMLGRDRGGMVTIPRETMELAAGMVVERGDTADGGMALRVLTVADMAERAIVAMTAPVDEVEQPPGDASVIAKPTLVLAKANRPIVLAVPRSSHDEASARATLTGLLDIDAGAKP